MPWTTDSNVAQISPPRARSMRAPVRRRSVLAAGPSWEDGVICAQILLKLVRQGLLGWEQHHTQIRKGFEGENTLVHGGLALVHGLERCPLALPSARSLCDH